MKLVGTSIRLPVSVAVTVLLAALFGALALLRLPVQMIPTLDRPEITVQTRYPAAGPLEVEEQVTRRQEELLNTVENLREMVSTSKENESTIILKYDWGTDKNVARLDVSEKIGAVRDLPDDSEEPIIRAVNSDEQSPIAWLVLVAREDLNDVRPVANDVVKPGFERVPGVGQVWFFGGEEREAHVLLDFPSLAARGIEVSEVRAALLQENRDIKAGGFDEGLRRFGVRTEGRYRSLEEIEQTIVKSGPLGPVRVRDLARVELGHEEPQFVIRESGRPALIFGILRKSGSNALEVMRGVDEVQARLNAQYRSRGIELVKVYDATRYIHEAIQLVSQNLIIGALLAIGVLLVFLRSRSAVLVLGLSIPISLITTFAFLWGFGRSLNIISLAGMTFVTGMVLDSAIVVVENIFRHRELGKGPARAAYDGTVEVWGAVLASTLTTLAVFLPIVFVEEEAGQLFRDIAIVVSIAVALSLLVAITVIPALAARLLRSVRTGSSAAIAGGGTRRRGARTTRLLGWILERRRRRWATIVGVLAMAVAISFGLAPEIDYLPEGNRNMIYVMLDTPPGYNLRQTERILRSLEEKFLPLPEVSRMFTIVRHERPNMGIILGEDHRSKRDIQAFVSRARKIARGVPGVRKVFATQAPLIRRGRIGSGNLELLVQGPELDRVQAIAARLEEQVEKLPGVEFVNPSFEVGKPERVVEVDRVRAAELGMTVSDIGAVVEASVAGTRVGTFDDAGREIDLRLMRAAGGIRSSRELATTPIFTPRGMTVTLGDVAHIESREGPTQIEHTNMDRSVKLSLGMERGLALGEAISRIDPLLQRTRARLPLGYDLRITGQAGDLERTWTAFRGAFAIALLVTYLLLASLFESFVIPLVILVSVPFAASGGILGLRALHAFDASVKLDTITMLGFVILIGVVVNNAILLVHQTLNRLREGADEREALLDSVSSRVRPILMTTTTTCFGILPLVFASGSGSELYRGLAATLVGGLSLATVVTLVLVPSVLSLVLGRIELSQRAVAEKV
ncbi:MAG: efflux RND transporter permease subunit [Myxococcota bacterium]